MEGSALGLSSLVEGEKTELTSSESLVQPGGGSFFAEAQAVTVDVRDKARFEVLILHGDLRDANASPPPMIATLVSPFEMRLAASSKSLPG